MDSTVSRAQRAQPALPFSRRIHYWISGNKEWRHDRVDVPVSSAVSGKMIEGFVMFRLVGWNVEFRECTEQEHDQAYEWWMIR